MSTSTGFKQQCPSCEAMVPIKDVGLVGRKIDCPKCKSRFVVLDPEEENAVGAEAEADSEADTPRPAKKPAKKTKPVAVGDSDSSEPQETGITAKTKPGKETGITAKTKPGKRRRGQDEEDAGEAAPDKKPAKKKGDPNSNKMMLGLALAGVGVVVLGFAAWLMFFKGGKDTPPKPGGGGSSATTNKDGKDGGADKDSKPDTKPNNLPVVATAEFTNLLLPKTDHVFHINFKEIWETPLGKALLAQVPDEYFKLRTGFSLASVDQVIHTESYREDWAFNLVHLTEPVNMAAVSDAMGLDKKPEKIKSYEYFVTRGDTPKWLNQLSRLSLSKKTQLHNGEFRKGPLAVHKYDNNTLVFADDTAMRKFLESDRQPTRKAPPKPPPQTDAKDKPGPSKDMKAPGDKGPPIGGPPKDMKFPGDKGPPGPPKDMKFPGGDKGGLPKDKPPMGLPKDGKFPGDQGPAKDFKPPMGSTKADELKQSPMGGPPKDMKMPGGGPPKDMKMPGGGPPKDMKMPGGGPPKDMKMPGMDKTGPPKGDDKGKPEDKKDPLQPLDDYYLTIDSALRSMLVRMDRPAETKERVLFKSATLRQDAAGRFKQVWDISNWFASAPATVDVVGSSLVQKNEDVYVYRNGLACNSTDSADGISSQLQGNVVPDFARFFTDVTGIKLPMAKEEPKKKDNANPGMRPPMGAPPIGGLPPMGGGPPQGFQPPQGGPPNLGPPKGDGGKDNAKEEEEEKDVTGIRIRQRAKAVIVRLTLALSMKEKAQLEKIGVLLLAGLKGELDLESGDDYKEPHRLGNGVRALAAKEQKFPVGAFPRQAAPERGFYPWEPDQRISWMAQLLPFMGRQTVYDNIQWQKSWSDNENLLAARTLVPEFLNPMYPRSSRFVNYPGMRFDVAATHFVGIGGLGEDIAEESDPDAVPRMGILGYNRQTAVSALQRGAGHTALMIQVPPESAAPWMAGGGSTVRGVPETRSIDPFVGNEKGTFVLMADGSVRFVSRNISSDAFKAMCTIQGKAPFNEADWKLVPPPRQGGMKAQEKPPAKVDKPQK